MGSEALRLVSDTKTRDRTEDGHAKIEDGPPRTGEEDARIEVGARSDNWRCQDWGQTHEWRAQRPTRTEGRMSELKWGAWTEDGMPGVTSDVCETGRMSVT